MACCSASYWSVTIFVACSSFAANFDGNRGAYGSVLYRREVAVVGTGFGFTLSAGVGDGGSGGVGWAFCGGAVVSDHCCGFGAAGLR